MSVLDLRVIRLGDVDIGVVDSTLGNLSGTMRLRRYFIPGKPKSAVLTYGCRPQEFERYRATFENSAMATTGASSSAFSTRGAIKLAVLGALMAIGALVLILRWIFGGLTAAPVRVSAVWVCPACKRHVPTRIAECRCGKARS